MLALLVLDFAKSASLLKVVRTEGMLPDYMPHWGVLDPVLSAAWRRQHAIMFRMPRVVAR